MLTLDNQLIPLGYQQIASLSGSVRLSPPEGAVYCLITVAGQTVRWRDDSTAPTASVGLPLQAGRELWYTGVLTTFEVIEETGGAELNVAYYRPK